MKMIVCFSLLSLATSAPAAWYKGNTHAHTSLSGHGDATPSEVAHWYHDHGYNFLVLSEHNRFIDPATVKLKEKRQDFVLVPGVEVTGAKNVHTTALNVKEVIPFKTSATTVAKILREHVEAIQSRGGEAISNHPNWQWTLTADDLFAVKTLKLFELYNGHPDVNVNGDEKRPSTEAIWDNLLTRGKRIFAVSSDDAHQFHEHSHTLSNPGRGWIMVEAPALTPEALVAAMIEGNFYASSGVMLSQVTRGPKAYELVVDLEATVKAIKAGKHMVGDKTARPAGLTVEFLGPNGQVLHQESPVGEDELRVSFSNQSAAYIRAKVIYTVKGGAQNISYYAWTQPWWRN